MKSLKALISKNTIHRAHAGVKGFFKEKLTCGTIVGFEDGTLGVYVDGDLAKYIKQKFNFVFISDYRIFLSYNPENQAVCYLNLSDYTDTLEYDDRDYYDYDINRIYDRVLKENEIKEFTENNFHRKIHNIVKGMKYIER